MQGLLIMQWGFLGRAGLTPKFVSKWLEVAGRGGGGLSLPTGPRGRGWAGLKVPTGRPGAPGFELPASTTRGGPRPSHRLTGRWDRRGRGGWGLKTVCRKTSQTGVRTFTVAADCAVFRQENNQEVKWDGGRRIRYGVGNLRLIRPDFLELNQKEKPTFSTQVTKGSEATPFATPPTTSTVLQMRNRKYLWLVTPGDQSDRSRPYASFLHRSVTL